MPAQSVDLQSPPGRSDAAPPAHRASFSKSHSHWLTVSPKAFLLNRVEFQISWFFVFGFLVPRSVAIMWARKISAIRQPELGSYSIFIAYLFSKGGE